MNTIHRLNRPVRAGFRAAALAAGLLVVGTLHAQTPPTNNLTLWLDAGAIAGLTDGSAVALWTNKGNVAANLTQVTPADRPLYKTNIINGLPAVRFDGASDFLASVAASTFMSSTQYTIFSVFSATAIDRNNAATYMNDLLVGDRDGYAGQYLKGSGPSYSALAYNYGGGDQSVGTTITTNAWYALVTRHEAGNIYVHKDGEADASTASGTTTWPIPSDVLQVGFNKPGYDGWFQGDIAEILIYNTALSSGDRASVESYLDLKYFAIPEPSSVLLMVAAGALAFVVRRSRGLRGV